MLDLNQPQPQEPGLTEPQAPTHDSSAAERPGQDERPTLNPSRKRKDPDEPSLDLDIPGDELSLLLDLLYAVHYRRGFTLKNVSYTMPDAIRLLALFDQFGCSNKTKSVVRDRMMAFATQNPWEALRLAGLYDDIDWAKHAIQHLSPQELRSQVTRTVGRGQKTETAARREITFEPLRKSLASLPLAWQLELVDLMFLFNRGFEEENQSAALLSENMQSVARAFNPARHVQE